MATKTFSATINEEGASAVKRGKIPSGLINALGGEKGNMIQFEVTGKFITGGRILRGREAEAARKSVFQQSRLKPASKPKAPAPAPVAAKPAKPTRPVAVKPVAVKPVAAKPVKPTKPVAVKSNLASAASKLAENGKVAQKVAPKKVAAVKGKANGRKTSVAYEIPAKPIKVGSGKSKTSLSK